MPLTVRAAPSAEFALRLTAFGAVTGMTVRAMRMALLSRVGVLAALAAMRRLPFRPLELTLLSRVAVLAALAAMRWLPLPALEMTLLSCIAVLTTLAVLATIRLGERPFLALRDRTRCGLHPLERLGGGHEIRWQLRHRDALAGDSFDEIGRAHV